MIKQRFLFSLSSLGKEWRWEGAAALAAGLTAELVVARDGTVPCKHFHLTEDRFVSHTGFICKTNPILITNPAPKSAWMEFRWALIKFCPCFQNDGLV